DGAAGKPAIDPVTGNLTFKLAPTASGSATVTVSLKDSGGTANSGVDTSPTQQFQISVSGPTHIWHNPIHALDVTNPAGTGPDNQVVAGDALAIINFINAEGARAVRPTDTYQGKSYDPANGAGSFTQPDAFVSPADALAVINWINSNGPGTPGPDGEGEGSGGAEGEASADSFFADLGATAAAPG